jgi:hypothetical protein
MSEPARDPYVALRLPALRTVPPLHTLKPDDENYPAT